MAAENSVRKMRLYRDRLLAQGLRPVQVWVQDSRAPHFQDSLNRQIANLDRTTEAETLDFIDKVAEEPRDRGVPPTPERFPRA